MFQKVLKVEKFAGLGDVEFAIPFGIIVYEFDSFMYLCARLRAWVAKGLKDRR